VDAIVAVVERIARRRLHRRAIHASTFYWEMGGGSYMDESDMDRREPGGIRRRLFLAGLSVAGAVGLAGCEHEADAPAPTERDGSDTNAAGHDHHSDDLGGSAAVASIDVEHVYTPSRGADAVVWTDGETYHADGTDGPVAAGSDPTSVVQAAIDSLSAGRDARERVVVTGDIDGVETLSVPSHTHLHVDGRLRLADRANAPLVRTENTSLGAAPDAGDGGDRDIRISGGVLDGNASNQSEVALGVFLNSPWSEGEGGTPHSNIELDVTVRNCYGHGVHPKGVRNLHVDLDVRECGTPGRSDADLFHNVYLRRCGDVEGSIRSTGSTTGRGVKLTRTHGCKLEIVAAGNAGDGIYLGSSTENVLTGLARDNGHRWVDEGIMPERGYGVHALWETDSHARGNDVDVST
jgi:hypothetical protein